ncbi:Ribosomal protein S4 [Spironucleus salmonicida]|uniref:40S ribosomal protein S4 n=1 Tax=Spironucleus salmonicida TaxID=348837 RepID=V6LN06_9EUKA|nr:Ribosomal protein S4 [Spironucleus salmonicida]|eukprot:EST45603.1 Ribosomal protein S4 [Spironucleus salmonicida]
MAGGPRKHLKRLSAPTHWQLAKLGGIWAPRPSAGPHKLQECLPLLLVLRNRLHLARDRREAEIILNSRSIKVDGKVRTDVGYPAGFMDVIEIGKLKAQYRIMYDILGRFTLVPIKADEAKFKLCRVKSVQTGKHGIPFIGTNDGRTIRFADSKIKVNDTIKIDLATGSIAEHFAFASDMTACITGGSAAGRMGKITQIIENAGTYSMVHLIDVKGQKFLTRMENVFVIGKNSSVVSVPTEKGVRPTKVESRQMRIQAVEKRMN